MCVSMGYNMDFYFIFSKIISTYFMFGDLYNICNLSSITSVVHIKLLVSWQKWCIPIMLEGGG